MYQVFRGSDKDHEASAGVHGMPRDSFSEAANKPEPKKHRPSALKDKCKTTTAICTCQRLFRRAARSKVLLFALGLAVMCIVLVREETSHLVHLPDTSFQTRGHSGYNVRPDSHDVDPLSPLLKVVVLDMSPQTMDDTNLMHRGADFLVRMGTQGTRKCCNFSISKLQFPDNKCQISIYNSNMSLKAPWNWAVYNATREAYLLGTDYYLILNDRTLLPGNWAEEYILKLSGLDPPNVGIEIRSSPTGGRNILFHRIHIDIFGYIYPWYIHTNSADTYLNNLYPEDMRIDIDSQIPRLATVVRGPDGVTATWISIGRHYLTGFLAASRMPRPKQDTRLKVIAMSLYGSNKRYVEGAIRNAQLAPLYLPNWVLRFYLPHPDLTEPIHVRHDVIKTLNDLGADIKYVNNDVRSVVPPMMWRFLVADDSNVDVFVVQDSDARIGSRVADGIHDWLRSNRSVYCMRDHPWHGHSALSGGMWGARRRDLDKLLEGQFVSNMIHYNETYGEDMKFLNEKVWPKVSEHAHCHDSVTCGQWPNAHPWPSPRHGLEHVGEIFNEYHVPFPSNRLKLNQTATNMKCEPHERIPDL